MTVKTAKTEDLATKQTEALVIQGMEGMVSVDRPAGDDQGTLGNEGIGRDDILMPRLGVAQLMSPELNPTNAKAIEGLQFTDLFNSVTRQVYGKGPLHFVVLRRDDPRWIEFNPLDQGGGIKDRNVPHGDPRTQFGPNGEKPAATMFYDFIVLLLTGLDLAEPLQNVIALSLKSSGIKAAKHLNFLIQQRGKKQICKGVYELRAGSDVDKKSGGTYATYKVKNAGWVTGGSALEALAVSMFESWKDREVAIDRDAAADPDSFNPADIEKGAATDM